MYDLTIYDVRFIGRFFVMYDLRFSIKGCKVQQVFAYLPKRWYLCAVNSVEIRKNIDANGIFDREMTYRISFVAIIHTLPINESHYNKI